MAADDLVVGQLGLPHDLLLQPDDTLAERIGQRIDHGIGVGGGIVTVKVVGVLLAIVPAVAEVVAGQPLQFETLHDFIFDVGAELTDAVGILEVSRTVVVEDGEVRRSRIGGHCRIVGVVVGERPVGRRIPPDSEDRCPYVVAGDGRMLRLLIAAVEARPDLQAFVDAGVEVELDVVTLESAVVVDDGLLVEAA